MRIDFDSHRRTSGEEDVEFLRSQGCSNDEIERRTGVVLDSIERRIQRRKDRSA